MASGTARGWTRLARGGAAGLLAALALSALPAAAETGKDWYQVPRSGIG